MRETSDLESFTNQAMGIAHSEMTDPEKRALFWKLFTTFRTRIKNSLMEEAADQVNEETFKRLREADAQ